MWRILGDIVSKEIIQYIEKDNAGYICVVCVVSLPGFNRDLFFINYLV